MRPFLFVAIAVLGSLLGSPAMASESRCQAPPGTAAVDQYCETVPSAGGGQSASPSGHAPLTIDKRTQRAIAKAGPDGVALDRLLVGHAGRVSQGTKSGAAVKQQAT